jgi:hypothetical protein
MVIAGIYFYIGSLSEETLKVVPEADKEFARVGEQIAFTAENSTGDIKSYLWDFDDGNTSDEVSPSYVYEISGWYNVTLIIESKNGKMANSTLLIGIQRNDAFEEGESGPIVVIRRGLGRGYAVDSEVGPNIGQPTIETRADINTAVGYIEYEVEFYWELPDNEIGWEVIHSEATFAGGGDVHFSYDVMPDEIPEEVQMYLSEIQVTVICWEGGWESALIGINVVFPMENLNRL